MEVSFLDKIGEIILVILTSVGGISGIIIIAVKFCSNIIAKRLEEKYSLKLSKELELFKSNIENKIYMMLGSKEFVKTI